MNILKPKREPSEKARLELKTNAFMKYQLEHAAAISGLTVTAFVMSAAADKAKKVIEQYEVTYLNAEVFDKLTSHLERENRAGPTEKMKEFRKRKSKHELTSFSEFEKF